MTINTDELIQLLGYAMSIKQEHRDDIDEVLSTIMDRLVMIEEVIRKLAILDSDFESLKKYYNVTNKNNRVRISTSLFIRKRGHISP